MISPTGLGIRVDSEGDGNYGASRCSRLHNGIDYLCFVGQDIVAPFDMFIDRIAKPKIRTEMSGIKWTKGKNTGRIFYFLPYNNLIGCNVKKGDVIGIAQSVSDDYNLPKMKDHIHFQINK